MAIALSKSSISNLKSMIRKLWPLPIAFSVLFLVLLNVYWKREAPKRSVPVVSRLANGTFVFEGRQIANLTPGHTDEEMKDFQVANEISPDWQAKVEDSLLAQGGADLKEVVITKESSYIWVWEGTPLYVEAVRVQLKNQNNETVNFRALIDSGTGKILKTWDHPVVDSGNPRKKGYRVDPRYHGQ
jgi:hypothetical protein